MSSLFATKDLYKAMERVRFVRPKLLDFLSPQAIPNRTIVRPLEISSMEKPGELLLTAESVDILERFNQLAVVEDITTADSLYFGILPRDFIVLPKYCGDEVYLKSQRFLSVFTESITMKISNPNELINFESENNDE